MYMNKKYPTAFTIDMLISRVTLALLALYSGKTATSAETQHTMELLERIVTGLHSEVNGWKEMRQFLGVPPAHGPDAFAGMAKRATGTLATETLHVVQEIQLRAARWAIGNASQEDISILLQFFLKLHAQ